MANTPQRWDLEGVDIVEGEDLRLSRNERPSRVRATDDRCGTVRVSEDEIPYRVASHVELGNEHILETRAGQHWQTQELVGLIQHGTAVTGGAEARLGAAICGDGDVLKEAPAPLLRRWS